MYMARKRALLFLLPLFLFFSAGFFYVLHILQLTTIYPNIYIDGIDVGGLSCEEAVVLLTANMDKTYLSDYLTLNARDKRYKIHFGDIDYVPDYEKAVEAAYNVGRTGNTVERLKEIWTVRRNGKSIISRMSFNKEKLLNMLNIIQNETRKEPENAQISIHNGKAEIKPHTVGFSVDVGRSMEKIEYMLVNRIWDDADLCYEDIVPDITVQMVENITYKLGEFETAFNPDNEARVHNIRMACGKIDQTLLLDGQEFSMDKSLGERTEQNGYRPAKVIVNNELVEGLGGGICQVASTMYNSVLLSGLEVLERRNHTLVPSYIEPGRDATISQGYIDLRFRNNTGYAVLIEAKTVGNKVKVTIWGCEQEVKTTARIRTKIIEIIEPKEIEYIPDSSLKAGVEKVVREAKPGYKVEVYRDILDMSGNVIKTEIISVDIYQPQKKKVIKGTKIN